MYGKINSENQHNNEQGINHYQLQETKTISSCHAIKLH